MKCNIPCKYSDEILKEAEMGLWNGSKVNKDRRGVITGKSNDGLCVLVKWDGNKSASSYHLTLITELLAEEIN